MEIRKEILSIVAEHLGVPPSSIVDTATSTEVPGWDSIHHLIILMAVEQKFAVRFGLDEMAQLDSVEKIFRAVKEQRASA